MQYPSKGPLGQGFSAAHQALDLGNKDWFNTPVVAPHAGTVTAAGQMGSGTNDAGLAVDVSGERYKSRMGHLNSISVKVGQVVKEGQEIGRMGYTGYTQPDNNIYGTHVHWVLWDNGNRVDGRKYATGGATPPTIGGTTVFETDAEVAEAYKLLRGNSGTAAERKSWIGQPKQRFFQVGLAEANAVRAAKAAAEAKVKSLTTDVNSLKDTVAQLKTQVASVTNKVGELTNAIKIKDDEIAKLKAEVAAGGNGEDSVQLNALGAALRWLITRLGLK